MPTYSKQEIDDIRAKPEAERTDPEKRALAAADAKQPEENEHMIPKTRLDEVLASNKELKEQVAALMASQKANQDKALAEQGKWQELAEARQREIDTLKQQAGKLTDYETTLKKTLDSQLESFAPEMRKLVPTALSVPQQLEWVAANRSILVKPTAQDIGAGRQGGKKKVVAAEIDENTKQAAAAYGMTAEEYVKFSTQPVLQPFGTTPDPKEGEEPQDET